jgi:hypothetical protein
VVLSGEVFHPRTAPRYAAWHSAMLAIGTALGLVAPLCIAAAEFSVVLVETPVGAAEYISIEGDVDVGDWSQFSRLLRKSPGTIGVLLRSNGGSADDGLAIAKLIFDRGLSTMVTGSCHSVCAVMFLAGRDRFITPTATLSVHSAYKQLGDWVVEDSIVNATVAWFIGHMGYPLPLARLWVSTPSDRMAPITVEMNDKLKLGFTVIDDPAMIVAQD